VETIQGHYQKKIANLQKICKKGWDVPTNLLLRSSSTIEERMMKRKSSRDD
jgi:hypothetical protein